MSQMLWRGTPRERRQQPRAVADQSWTGNVEAKHLEVAKYLWSTLCEELEEGKASGEGHQQDKGILHLIQGFEEWTSLKNVSIWDPGYK